MVNNDDILTWLDEEIAKLNAEIEGFIGDLADHAEYELVALRSERYGLQRARNKIKALEHLPFLDNVNEEVTEPTPELPTDGEIDNLK